MNRQEILEVLGEQSREEHVAWVQRLGLFLTVAARSDYVIQNAAGDIAHLMGYNEMQHTLYGYLAHFTVGTDWGTDAFVDSLHDNARAYGIEGGLRSAVGWSLRKIE